MKRNKSTVNSYSLISYHFHAKSKGKQLWNKTKFKLIWKHKNKLNNSHGRMIIQLGAAIFERIRNVQIQDLQTVLISLKPVAFSCVLHLQTLLTSCCLQGRNVRFCNTLFDVCHGTENRPEHFFSWNIFYSLKYKQNFLTNRIAGKQMNIKEIKLLSDASSNRIKSIF